MGVLNRDTSSQYSLSCSQHSLVTDPGHRGIGHRAPSVRLVLLLPQFVGGGVEVNRCKVNHCEANRCNINHCEVNHREESQKIAAIYIKHHSVLKYEGRLD